MNNGRPAPRDDSFRRSASGAAIRGALLILAALVIGVILLQQTKTPTPQAASTPVIVSDTTPTGDTVPGAAVDPASSDTVATTTLPARRSPAEVRVLVVNGSGVNRAAARVRAYLSGSGWDLQKASDGVRDNFADSVFYQPGFEQDARAVAALLSVTDIRPTPAEVTVKAPIPPFDVQVMVGPVLAQQYKTQPLSDGVAPAAAAAVATATAAKKTSTATKKKSTTTVKKASAGSASSGSSSGATANTPTAAAADSGASDSGSSVERTPVVAQPATVE